MAEKGRGRGGSISQKILRSMDIFAAILLLTGQITIGGVFITIEGFALSLSGPFTGSGAVGKTANANFVLDGMDIIAALLLILGEVDVIGTFVTADRFTIVIGGPPFGGAKMVGYAPHAEDFFRSYTTTLMNRFANHAHRKG